MDKGVGEGKGSPEARPRSQDRKRSEVHITWDEPTIAEHDKLRGTRQKIDEPSTPYHYGSGESSTGSDCESADGKGPSLSAASSAPGSPAQRAGRSRSGSGSGSGDRRGSILKVMADVSAALPSESALRKERQARWDSDVSEGSSREDKEKARKFKQHREAHYNEFKALQEWRDKRSGDGMEDDSASESDAEDATEERRRRRPGAAGGGGVVVAAAAADGEVHSGAGAAMVVETENEEAGDSGATGATAMAVETEDEKAGDAGAAAAGEAGVPR
ncbi:unnamed protein product [Ectocarpus sp. 4 AP-2014]